MSNPEDAVEDGKSVRAKVIERINDVHDNWISVPTWGKYMRALGMHTRPVQQLIERSWARRPS